MVRSTLKQKYATGLELDVILFLALARWSLRQRADRDYLAAAFRNRMFLAPSSFAAITSVCAHMASRTFFWDRGCDGLTPDSAVGARDDAKFVPWEQQESSSEHRFSSLRRQFLNGQLSAKDVIWATRVENDRAVQRFRDASWLPDKGVQCKCTTEE